jgi:hypothetical protein
MASNDNFNFKISKKVVLIVGAVIVVVIAAVIFFMNKSDKRFTNAVENCGGSSSAGLTLASDGKSITIDGAGEDGDYATTFTTTVCLLGELKAPETVLDRMGRTTSLMGVQDADWEGINASWTYHPDNGLDVAIELTQN